MVTAAQQQLSQGNAALESYYAAEQNIALQQEQLRAERQKAEQIAGQRIPQRKFGTTVTKEQQLGVITERQQASDKISQIDVQSQALENQRQQLATQRAELQNQIGDISREAREERRYERDYERAVELSRAYSRRVEDLPPVKLPPPRPHSGQVFISPEIVKAADREIRQQSQGTLITPDIISLPTERQREQQEAERLKDINKQIFNIRERIFSERILEGSKAFVLSLTGEKAVLGSLGSDFNRISSERYKQILREQGVSGKNIFGFKLLPDFGEFPRTFMANINIGEGRREAQIINLERQRDVIFMEQIGRKIERQQVQFFGYNPATEENIRAFEKQQENLLQVETKRKDLSFVKTPTEEGYQIDFSSRAFKSDIRSPFQRITEGKSGLYKFGAVSVGAASKGIQTVPPFLILNTAGFGVGTSAVIKAGLTDVGIISNVAQAKAVLIGGALIGGGTTAFGAYKGYKAMEGDIFGAVGGGLNVLGVIAGAGVGSYAGSQIYLTSLEQKIASNFRFIEDPSTKKGIISQDDFTKAAQRTSIRGEVMGTDIKTRSLVNLGQAGKRGFFTVNTEISGIDIGGKSRIATQGLFVQDSGKTALLTATQVPKGTLVNRYRVDERIHNYKELFKVSGEDFTQEIVKFQTTTKTFTFGQEKLVKDKDLERTLRTIASRGNEFEDILKGEGQILSVGLSRQESGIKTYTSGIKVFETQAQRLISSPDLLKTGKKADIIVINPKIPSRFSTGIIEGQILPKPSKTPIIYDIVPSAPQTVKLQTPKFIQQISTVSTITSKLITSNFASTSTLGILGQTSFIGALTIPKTVTTQKSIPIQVTIPKVAQIPLQTPRTLPIPIQRTLPLQIPQTIPIPTIIPTPIPTPIRPSSLRFPFINFPTFKGTKKKLERQIRKGSRQGIKYLPDFTALNLGIRQKTTIRRLSKRAAKGFTGLEIRAIPMFSNRRKNHSRRKR
jgi:hypothetical protein